ncbi:hypothetical protein QJS10_CPB18g00725 [Acorus calamus]|uniref:Uncharacterized protein n=1 Tax=Acorus calamus TaxID=4465 RepID=A0AAV9CME4_ACOCL|nr:hypothetical protein QJS10_CPB18g00725 [Acorus calamus]
MEVTLPKHVFNGVQKEELAKDSSNLYTDANTFEIHKARGENEEECTSRFSYLRDAFFVLRD